MTVQVCCLRWCAITVLDEVELKGCIEGMHSVHTSEASPPAREGRLHPQYDVTRQEHRGGS